MAAHARGEPRQPVSGCRATTPKRPERPPSLARARPLDAERSPPPGAASAGGSDRSTGRPVRPTSGRRSINVPAAGEAPVDRAPASNGRRGPLLSGAIGKRARGRQARRPDRLALLGRVPIAAEGIRKAPRLGSPDQRPCARTPARAPPPRLRSLRPRPVDEAAAGRRRATAKRSRGSGPAGSAAATGTPTLAQRPIRWRRSQLTVRRWRSSRERGFPWRAMRCDSPG